MSSSVLSTVSIRRSAGRMLSAYVRMRMVQRGTELVPSAAETCSHGRWAAAYQTKMHGAEPGGRGQRIMVEGEAAHGRRER